MCNWGSGLLLLASTAASLLQRRSGLSFCSAGCKQGKAINKGICKSVWEEGAGQLQITSGPFSVALIGRVCCMLLY